MSVIKKWRFTGEGEPLSFFYGIEILDSETDFCFSPTYPFSDSIESLRDFIEVYEEKLVDFYANGWNFSFATFLYIGVIDRNGTHNYSEMDDFRNYWFDRGVVIY